MAYRHRRSGSTGATSWLFQRVSGLVLVLLTIGHYFLMHQTTAAGHTFDAVVGRLTGPYGVWFKMGYLTFVVLGLYHGLNGIYNIIRDIDMSAGWHITAAGVLVVVGLAFAALGFSTIMFFNPYTPQMAGQ